MRIVLDEYIVFFPSFINICSKSRVKGNLNPY